MQDRLRDRKKGARPDGGGERDSEHAGRRKLKTLSGQLLRTTIILVHLGAILKN